ncbi:MAG: tetratricopeptide repeat protein [Planctomycetota bacterium]|nr:tetratricopeptide repeat protein [Planctomycetota bacterium]
MEKRSASWKSLHEEAERAYEAGAYVEAEGKYLGALRATKRLRPHDRRRIKSIEGLAHVYRMMQKPDLAATVYASVPKIIEAAYGPDDPRLAECLEHYVLLFVIERLAESERLLLRSQAIRVKAWGRQCPDLALSDVSFGILYSHHGNLLDAERSFKQAVQRVEYGRGYRHPDLVFYLRQLAGFYRACGRYSEAEPLYERVLALIDHGRGWGEDVLIESLEDLGRIYRFLGKEEKAQVMFGRIRELWRKQYGDTLTA